MENEIQNNESQQPVITEKPEQGAESTGGAPSSEEQPKYDLEGFNKHFGSSYEDESSLKEAIDNSNKLSDYESRFSSLQEELETAKSNASKYNDFIDFFDPEKFYGDEETWRYVETRKKFHDKDPAVVQQIQDSSFNTLSDLDKLILADKLKIPGNISNDVRQQGVLRKLGIETDDLSELTTLDKYTIASAVADQKGLFDEIRNFKPEPMKFDIVAEKEKRDQERENHKLELTKKWKPFAESLLKNYKEAKAFSKDDKGNPVEIFKYSADQKFQSEFIEPFMASIMNSGMEPNEENLKIAANYLDQQFKNKYFDQIVNEAIKYGKTLTAEAAHNEIHNDKPQNTNQAPVPSGNGEALTLKERIQRRVSQTKK